MGITDTKGVSVKRGISANWHLNWHWYMLVALAPSQEGDLLHGLQQHICHQLDYDELM